MARKKITEFRAKNILYKELSEYYEGISFNLTTDLIGVLKKQLRPNRSYVVKVDQGIKKRFKTGLMKVNVKDKQVIDFIYSKKDHHFSFLIEPYIQYATQKERYLALNLEADGINILFSEKGGVDVEDNNTDVNNIIYNANNNNEIARRLGITVPTLVKLIKTFKENHFCFLECNPYIIIDSKVRLIDAACEVDDTALLSIKSDSWGENDFVYGQDILKSEEENSVIELSGSSLSSFSLNVLNPNGSIGLLLSGGGASLVIADEFYNLGLGDQLINYGEYSGNPNQEETIVYTKAVLSLLFKSNSRKKILVIGGGVANFTDILVTFTGIVQAMEESFTEIKKNKILFFVRRGGPNQEAGLKMIQSFFEKNRLLNQVFGPKLSISEFVKDIVKTYNG